MIIGSKVAENDENWMHFLELLTIIDYVFSPLVYPRTPAYLQVSEHHGVLWAIILWSSFMHRF